MKEEVLVLGGILAFLTFRAWPKNRSSAEGAVWVFRPVERVNSEGGGCL